MSSENRGLSERKKQILKAIVDAHIEGGEPVGSKYILQSKHINCSSATIRNEMAELEEMGYLEQPHASAGRVPSELGYRFYVDALIERYARIKDAEKLTSYNTMVCMECGSCAFACPSGRPLVQYMRLAKQVLREESAK